MSDQVDGKTFYYVTLVLKYQGLELVFIPENPEAIKNIDIKAASGCFDTHPSNGEFGVNWSPVAIVIKCARNGGGMSITLKTTPELLMSLKSALKKWKDLMMN